MTQPLYTLYRIYYRNKVENVDVLIYVGRTKQPLKNRLRGHFFQKPMHRTICIEQVSKIEYAEFKTEADMNLYEIYYILMLKPPLNVDDKTRDYPTVTLPEVEWHEWHDDIFDKWLKEITEKSSQYEKDLRRLHAISEDIRVVRSLRRTGEITEDECFDRIEALQAERMRLDKELYG